MITYKQYLKNQAAHDAYYSQFINEFIRQRVASFVNVEILAKDYAKGDIHLNESYSCAEVWDRVLPVLPFAVAMTLKETGGNNSTTTSSSKNASPSTETWLRAVSPMN